MNLKRFVVVIASLCASLAIVAAPAQAQSANTPTADAYSGLAGQVGGSDDGSAPQDVSDSGVDGVVNTGEVSASSSGVLPFTGLQLGILALTAIALLGGGLLLRRTATRRAS